MSYFRDRDELSGLTGMAGGWEVREYRHPATGPTGETLYTSVFCLKSTAPNLLMVVSGTHGVEGPAGALVQKRLVRQLKAGAIKLPTDVGLLLVHALNPWGYAHGRRTDHQNVDVNRGCGSSFHSERAAAYDAVRHLVEPAATDPGRLIWERLQPILADREQAAALQCAVTPGQYHSPRGLFYGGTELCWSGQTMATICSTIASCRRLAVVDIHTGLGEYAKGDLLSPARENEEELIARLRLWFGCSGVQFLNLPGAKSVSSPVSGDLFGAINRWMMPKTEVTGVAVEMGNQTLAESFPWLVIENQLRHQGKASPAEFQSVFWPVTDEFWRGALWSRSYNVIRTMLAALSE